MLFRWGTINSVTVFNGKSFPYSDFLVPLIFTTFLYNNVEKVRTQEYNQFGTMHA